MSAVLKDSFYGSDAPEPMSADDLASALHVHAMRDPDWLIDAVTEACVNGDLLFLQRMVERHVPGWVRS